MGCSYTGRAGGPTRTEMPTAIWACAAAEKEIIRTANNSQRVVRLRFMVALRPLRLDRSEAATCSLTGHLVRVSHIRPSAKVSMGRLYFGYQPWPCGDVAAGCKGHLNVQLPGIGCRRPK